MRWLVIFALIGCSGGGSSTPAAFHYSVNTTSYGSSQLACDAAASSVFSLNGQLIASCNQTTGTNSSKTLGVVGVANFNGSNTYTFTGSATADNGTVQFDLAGYNFDSSVTVSAGQTAPTCSVTITAPSASPNKNDPISGTFHCDNLVGIPYAGGTQVTTSVDGSFDGVESI